MYDHQVGRTKGTYGFGKSLIGTAIDLGTLLQKLQSPVGWFDPELHRTIRQGFEVGVGLGKAYYALKYGTLKEKKDLFRNIQTLVLQVHNAASKSVQAQWAEAKRTGKQEELIEKWKTRILLEVGTLFIGAGELSAARSAAKDLQVTGDFSRTVQVGQDIMQGAKGAEAIKDTAQTGEAVAALPNLGGSKELEKTLNDLNELYRKAPEAKLEIDNLADNIAREHSGNVAKVPLKSRERALEKINSPQYRGQAHRIKDLARNTVVVPEGKEKDALASLLRARPDIDPKTVKIIDSATDQLGYSGINVTVPTKAGISAEIQISSPKMIFAKEKPEIARTILGDDRYNQIANTPDLPQGGLGHEFYEQWRSLPAGSSEADAIAEQSRAYYDTFRR